VTCKHCFMPIFLIPDGVWVHDDDYRSMFCEPKSAYNEDVAEPTPEPAQGSQQS
jgi:hypothetical protein